MSEDIERIDQIVGKFLEYGRAGHGPSGPRSAAASEWIEVAGLIDHLESAYRTQIAAGSLSLDGQVHPADARWRGDPLDLVRVLANLIENACRYGQTGESGRSDVAFRVDRDKAGLKVVFRDHGRGVPPDQFERLLRPFSRLDTERNSKGGAGLGLAIVTRIAQRYDGGCRLSAADGGGLQVELTLKDDPLA